MSRCLEFGHKMLRGISGVKERSVILGTMKFDCFKALLLRTARRRRKGIEKSWISPIFGKFWSQQMGELS